MTESAAQLRYAVLWHSDIADPHFDLLVETHPGSDLATWRSPVWPIEEPTSVKRLKDHRRLYLEYEGYLTQSRGQVERVGDGTCLVAIGENAVWKIQFLNRPITLQLHPISADQWTAVPE